MYPTRFHVFLHGLHRLSTERLHEFLRLFYPGSRGDLLGERSDDWLTYSLLGLVTNHRRGSISILGLSMEVRFPTDSTRGEFSSPSLRSSPSFHGSSLLINRLWNQGTFYILVGQINHSREVFSVSCYFTKKYFSFSE